MYPKQTEKTGNPELAELEVQYRLHASAYRQHRDHVVATWRDMIHNAIMETEVNFKLLHDVMDSMDRFLNTSKHSPLTD